MRRRVVHHLATLRLVGAPLRSALNNVGNHISLRLLSATKPEVSIRWTALESAPHKGVLKAFHLRLLPVPVAGRE
jgi:hypothetical protein